METNEFKELLDEQSERLEILLKQTMDERFGLIDQGLKQTMDERFEQSEKRWDERFDEFAFAIKESFNKVDERFDRIEFRLDEHDKRFDANDERHEELKHMVYSNGDAIARMSKKMDEEFSAATIQRSRLSDRIGRLEHTHGFV